MKTVNGHAKLSISGRSQFHKGKKKTEKPVQSFLASIQDSID